MDINIVVLYGTQTNTAKQAAEEIGREATRRKLQLAIMEFDEFDIRKLP